MPIIESQVDRNGDDYKKNREKMLAAIAEFRAAEASVQATSDKSRDRFAKRKQLMPRERIALLLDRGAPFLELMPLAGYRMHDDKDGSSAGGGSVAGIGYVEGVRCVVTASNSAIKGGTSTPMCVRNRRGSCWEPPAPATAPPWGSSWSCSAATF